MSMIPSHPARAASVVLRRAAGMLAMLGGALAVAGHAGAVGLTLERDLGVRDGHRLCRYSNGQVVRQPSELRACPMFHEGPPPAAAPSAPLSPLAERTDGYMKRCVYSLPGTPQPKEIQVPRTAPCPSNYR